MDWTSRKVGFNDISHGVMISSSSVEFHAAERLNWHLKMNAKCSLYISRLANFTQYDAKMIGVIFRRIVFEQIFIFDLNYSDIVKPAVVEYKLINEINDHGEEQNSFK